MRLRKSYLYLLVILTVLFITSVVYKSYSRASGQTHPAAGRLHAARPPIASITSAATDVEPSTEPAPGDLVLATDLNSILDRRSRQPIISSQPRDFGVTSALLRQSEIVVVVVACMMRLSETLNMIKSVLIFHLDHRPLRFVVFTEALLMQAFSEKLQDWQVATKSAFEFDIMPLKFPESNTKEWRELFKPCASQRLFLPVSGDSGVDENGCKLLTGFCIICCLYFAFNLETIIFEYL